MAVTLNYLWPPTGATPPALGVPVNEVIVAVTTDGTATSEVLTHNLEMSTQDLGFGLPEVDFEPLSVGFYTITPSISAKAANTITLAFTATAGTFNVRIKRPNTIER